MASEHIQKTDEGGLIVGLAGERQTGSFKFYAVFKENEEYTVRCGSQELGTIVLPPPVGEKIALAGHVWIVEEVDHRRHLVYCEQVKGKVPAYFGLCPGDIHTKVLERMRNVLREDAAYPYLMKNAAARLAEARHAARNSGMTEEVLVNLGGDMWCLFPWLGSYAFLALERFDKDKVRAAAGDVGAGLVAAVLHAVQDESIQRGIFQSSMRDGEAAARPDGAGLQGRDPAVREIR